MSVSETPDERAEFVAAMRRFLDLIEDHPDLPVPFRNVSQAGLFGVGHGAEYRPLTQPEKFAQLRAIATQLGVEVSEDSDGYRKVSLKIGPVEYLIFVGPEKPARLPSRVVDASEDERLVVADGGVRA